MSLQKAIDIIVQDVFSRARSRKQAIEEARQYHQTQRNTTYSAIAAAAAARRDQAGGSSSSNTAEARRTWHGEVPSLSQRLHGWRYLNAEDDNVNSTANAGAVGDFHYHAYTNRNQTAAEETTEYDAIIADAQRQVASPLPMLNFTSTSGQEHPYNHDEEPLFDSSDWPDLNPGLGNSNSTNIYGQHSPSWSDDEDSDIEEHRSRLRAVESALAAVRAQRDNARTNLTRLSTIQGNGNLSTSSPSNNSASSRLRILQRLEQRRRDLMERAEQQRSSNNASAANANRSYPSYFNTSFQRTSTENILDRDVPNNVNERFPPTIPIIVGGDFSTLPSTSSNAAGGAESTMQTLRASYGPLQRNNSIRRSGFHAGRGQQSSPPNANAALSAANALLPRTAQRPLNVHRPRTPGTAATAGAGVTEGSTSEAPSTTQRQQLDTLFGRQRQSSADLGDPQLASHGNEVSSFEDFSRNARQASRGAREDEEAGSQENRGTGPENRALSGSATAGPPSFSVSLYDPMLGSSPVEGGDSVTELLGSSSSVAGLGNMNSEPSAPSSSLFRASPAPLDSRRSIVPPRAPILSRRSFPLDSTPAAATPASVGSAGSAVATGQARSASPSAAAVERPSPQRATSVPERRPIHRPEEVVNLGYFLNIENSQTSQHD
ncbi:hypothetical protein P389DRAFT_56376 [Cystobasidium minutum MCA 4210]|uniref:uncharacterized protein n=1 Tax=Cystobasidium minutum MCA 4210 TaxID=1397322 RepID=UPI0034CFEA02|eukprot:jgi/Rhomi1/56376/CE56375_2357